MMAVAVRGRVAWRAPLLLFAAVLLLGSLAFAIANLDRGAETLPQLPEIGGSPGTAPFGPTGAELQVVWQVLIGSILISGIVAAIFVKWKGGQAISVWELLGYLFGIGLIGGMIAFWPEIVAAFGSLSQLGGTGSSGTSPGGTGLGQLPTSVAFPLFLLVVLIVIVAVWLFAFGARTLPELAGLGRGRQPERERRRLEAASAVRRTLLDLEAGGDFRTAVLACYQRMCSLFATKGVARQEALTPREIEVLALAELGLSQGSVDDLTGLFEEARYSEHEIGPAQRDRALECLGAIRRELEG
jgi:hypothetical protein